MLMRKTSVYLTDDEVARLASLADREGTSQAEVLRRAIRSYDRPGTGTGTSHSPGARRDQAA